MEREGVGLVLIGSWVCVFRAISHARLVEEVVCLGVVLAFFVSVCRPIHLAGVIVFLLTEFSY